MNSEATNIEKDEEKLVNKVAVEEDDDGQQQQQQQEQQRATLDVGSNGSVDEAVKNGVKRAREVEEDREGLFEKLREAFAVEKLPKIRDASDGLPGMTGILKEEPDFFIVEEVIVEEPTSEEGKFCWITLRRSGLDTKSVQWRLHKLLGVRAQEIGFAGLKDKHATTQQTFSIALANNKELTMDIIKQKIESCSDEPKLEIIGEPRLCTKSLRPGDLKGNKFRIVVSQLEVPIDEAYERAQKIWENLNEKQFIPNYFGVQRMGDNCKNALQGFGMVSAGLKYAENGGAINKRDFRKWAQKNKKTHAKNIKKNAWSQGFKLNAFQSGIFNSMVAERMKRGLLAQDLVGDYIMHQQGGRPRLVETEDQVPGEADKLEGFGFCFYFLSSRLPALSGAHMEIYQTVMNELGLSSLFGSNLEILKLFGATQLSNRPGRLCINKLGLQIDKHDTGVQFTFELPKGSYATSVLREFI